MACSLCKGEALCPICDKEEFEEWQKKEANRIKCPECKGTGHDINTPCSKCRGYVSKSSRTKTCSQCNGAGIAQCNVCDGYGSVDKNDINFSKKDKHWLKNLADIGESMSEEIEQMLASVVNDDNVGALEIFNNLMSDKTANILGQAKQVIAQNLIASPSAETETPVE